MRAVVQVDKRTRNVISRFESATEAAKAVGYNLNCVLRACKESRVWMEDWYLRFEEDFDPDEDISGKRGCPVYTVDLRNGRKEWYPTVIACAEALFVHRTTVFHAIRYGYRLADHYRVYYAGRRFTWT